MTRQHVHTNLVCGFLGAGKTTFLRAQLSDRRLRTAVLVNEFGDLGLDGGAIRAAGGSDDLQVVEMAGGCICCSAKLAMADTILKLVEDCRPERLFIEPSGIAEASEIIRILQGPALQPIIRLSSVITVVDAETLLQYSEPDAFGTFFLDQVGNGDLILVNKMDLVSPDVLAEVLARLCSFNPTALIVPTAHGRIEMALSVRGERAVQESEGSTVPWDYFCLAINRPLSPLALNKLNRLLTSEECGSVLRAKGVIPITDGKRLELQLAGSRMNMGETLSAVSPRFSCIGFHLDHKRLASCFSAGGDLEQGDLHECP